MSAPGPLRLAVVLSHPTQYYSPWFRWMTAAGRVQLRVFYLWDFGVTAQTDPGFGAVVKWDVDLLSGYDHEFVPNVARDPGTHHFRGLDNPTLLERLAAWQPDAVLLFGYRFASHLRLIRRSRWPLIFRGDSHLLGQTRVGWLKRLILGRIYARFAAVTYVGAANREYFQALGVPDRKLFFAPHSVNQDHFTPNPAYRAEADKLRESLRIAGRTVVVFAGKLVASKQPVELAQAFLAANLPNTALVFVGDGAERARLEELAAANPAAAIRFLPFANQTEMPARYLLGDIFCLPSRGFAETWGLAVNEAMHLGVPCLVSDRVGCQRDLVSDGETGWVFASESAPDLTRALHQAVADVARDRSGFSARAQARAAHYSYASSADGLYAAAEFALRPR